jgi:tetratricopeptide (TPR) repeat protein
MSDAVQIIQSFENMLAKGQDNALLRYGLGNAYLQQQDFPNALTHLAQCVVLNPKYSAGWKAYGNALSAAQQFEKAVAIYTQGIEIAEENKDKQAVKEMQVFLKRAQKHLVQN